MSVLNRMWARLRGKKGDPTFGVQIAAVGAGAAIISDQADGADTPSQTEAVDYGWSGDHLSGSDVGGGGFDGGFGGGDAGGGGGF